MSNKLRFALAAAAGLYFASAAGAPTATAGSMAQGCNGVVNILVWGCAPWDNNNGPKYPYYRKKKQNLPANQTQIVDRNGQKMALYNGQYYPLAGGNVIAPGGANVVASGGGNVVASGGGNMISVWSQ